MKKALNILLISVITLILSCSGSDTYRGQWKAMAANGEKFEIVFDAKSLTVKDNTGKETRFDYTQNSVSIQNSVETYGINVSDGRKYLINFPIADDESKGLIKDANGVPVYTIGKTGYISYEDLYKLQ